MTDQIPTVVDRFWAKVNKNGPLPEYAPDLGNCWLWTAYHRSDGYGQFRESPRTVRVHRWAYEQEYGPIPDGLQLDHLCRVHSCVKPSHLEAVTAAENSQRGETGLHQRIKIYCPQGHPYDEENTYVSQGRRECRTCNRESTRVSYAKHGRRKQSA